MTPSPLLIVDDDTPFRERLSDALRRKGYLTLPASGVAEALQVLESHTPAGAVVDLRMKGESGLGLIPRLLHQNPAMRVLILTGYGSIATAVEAVRLGAADYLTKPADADQIDKALRQPAQARTLPQEALTIPTLDQVEWEHLQRVLNDCGQNISQAARILGIERRTLQRKLQKYAP